MNIMYTVLMPAETADQFLAIYREHAVSTRSLSVWKPILSMLVLKEWERHNLPIRG
jgi:hypothetical protein